MKLGGAELRPKFSVIVPVYNVEPYLERCIESLINQTLKDIEIILVDDGSPDNCPAICDRDAAEDKRIKVIHKKNEGVSAARNDGLAMAGGEWVICCDSDDWMEEDALENFYKAGTEKNADVVIADINRIKGNEIQYNQYFAHEFTYDRREDLDELVKMTLQQTYCPDPPAKMAVAYGGPWNKAVKQELIADKNIQFDIELLGLYDDTLYTVHLYANAECVTYIQKAVYNYVLVSTSLTKVYKANALDISDRVYAEFRKFLNEYAPDGKWDRAYDALVIRRFEECLRMYFFSEKNEKPHKEVMDELKKTMHSEPYLSAGKNVEMDRLLSHQAKVARLMKVNSAYGLWGLYKVKKMAGKI